MERIELSSLRSSIHSLQVNDRSFYQKTCLRSAQTFQVCSKLQASFLAKISSHRPCKQWTSNLSPTWKLSKARDFDSPSPKKKDRSFDRSLLEVERIELSSLANFITNIYMLIIFKLAVASDGRRHTGKQPVSWYLESQPQKTEPVGFILGKMTVILKTLVNFRSPRRLNG